jgi:hypothetical protein
MFLGQLAAKGHTIEPQTPAPGAVDDDSVFWSPHLQSLQDDAVAPTAPPDGEDALAARTQARVIG